MAEKPKLFDADHPYRKSAIAIIEEIIEPLLLRKDIKPSKGLEGEPYYETEDSIVLIIDSTMKAYRHQNYEKYRNQRVTVEVGGLLVDCFVHDIKVVDGTVQYQVKPVAGDKAIWVSRFAEVK